VKRRDPAGRPRHKWDNNIKLDLGELKSEVMDWIHHAWDTELWWALANVAMKFKVG